MKIISGKYKGRIIKGYNISGTRPTMDRVKESVFATIYDYLFNSIVLDLFAGSGNLGIEALSNGARKVYFNDYNKECIKVIKNVVNELGISEYHILNNDYHDALKFYQKEKIKFNIIFLDPPYKEHIIQEIIKLVLDNDLLYNNGLIVCEVDEDIIYSDDRLELLKEKKYGDKKVFIYKLRLDNDKLCQNILPK